MNKTAVCTQLKIGKLELKNNLMLAPMAGVTDSVFRLLAKEGGAGLVCAEMLSSNALSYNDKKTRKMLNLSEEEHPVSVQIFGSNPGVMAEAAKIVEDSGAAVVDINFGCPVNKVIKTGAGASLLKNQKLMCDILEKVISVVKIPVTVKTRTGNLLNENLAPQIIKLCQETGVSAVIIHGRAAEFMHSGAPDLKAIKEAVAVAKIPIIGNGGIYDEKSAFEFMDATGCSGIMVGRAAIGDPHIFNRIEYYFRNGEVLKSPSWELRAEYLKRHAKLSMDYYGGKIGIIRLRKLAPYYLKGLPNATRIRERFNHIENLYQLDELLSHVWKSPYFE
ncbi:MAG: tRNA dihydrouridine synthase DusB [Elusimicrobia bacterium]|nr:tRNA dihydrouridine synthase DusB [Candidatus Liberimonas magnetica]